MEKRVSKQEILDMIKEYMQVEKIPPIIIKQLNGYILSGISTLDIARCINYYCETLKKEISSIYGISFVPNILEEVQKYFKKLQEIRDQGQLTGVEIVNTEIHTYRIKGKIRHKNRKKKSLDFNDIFIKDDDIINK